VDYLAFDIGRGLLVLDLAIGLGAIGVGMARTHEVISGERWLYVLATRAMAPVLAIGLVLMAVGALA
jgi:hypothetical protein